jgi:hypothetical protein
MKVLALAAGFTMAFIGSSFAQAPQATNPNNNSQNQAQQFNRQQVQSHLQKSGFTDIKIMPESYFVRAKDKSGNSVMMVINPDSVTGITEISNGQSGAATTGTANSQARQTHRTQAEQGAPPGKKSTGGPGLIRPDP